MREMQSKHFYLRKRRIKDKDELNQSFPFDVSVAESKSIYERNAKSISFSSSSYLDFTHLCLFLFLFF